MKRGWETHVLGKGRLFKDAEDAVRTYYSEDPKITDQYLDAFVIVDDRGESVGPIKDGDGVIFFNFRGDRAIEISRAFTEKDFDGFDRGPLPKPSKSFSVKALDISMVLIEVLYRTSFMRA